MKKNFISYAVISHGDGAAHRMWGERRKQFIL